MKSKTKEERKRKEEKSDNNRKDLLTMAPKAAENVLSTFSAMTGEAKKRTTTQH